MRRNTLDSTCWQRSSNAHPSGSHTVGWGSVRVCRWPRRCSRYTPDTTAVSMMCCSHTVIPRRYKLHVSHGGR